jgi:putative phosphoribosyl transferase
MTIPNAAVRDGRFDDRCEAGRKLAERLLSLATAHPVVVALPRGGVPVAREVALALNAPLDILAVRKIGAPQNPEYGIGAVAEDGTHVFDPEAIAILGIDGATLKSMVAREVAELRRRVALYRDSRPPIELSGRTVIVVDDGIATGVTDAAALRAVRRRNPQRLVLAVPVCAPDSMRRLREHADEVVCVHAPPLFHGVGQWYRDFSQVSDEEVMAVLEEFRDAAV